MYERNSTKTIIIKQTIENEVSKNSNFIPFFTIFYAIITFLISLVFWFISSFGLKSPDTTTIIRIFLYVITVLTYGVLIVSYIWLIFSALSQTRKLKNGEFCVITDEVVYKEEKEKYRRGIYKTIRTIHFSKCGEIEISNDIWYQITSKHDTYYMVVHSSDQTNPHLYYPAKLYEYVE